MVCVLPISKWNSPRWMATWQNPKRVNYFSRWVFLLSNITA
ncbi:Uncharacterised protein [Vibrio cholerae]|nr:Uncharacterised protein [Vibrio cholerae]CSI53784.1 Uncharacterised protein [Vibrio cholerae]